MISEVHRRYYLGWVCLSFWESLPETGGAARRSLLGSTDGPDLYSETQEYWASLTFSEKEDYISLYHIMQHNWDEHDNLNQLWLRGILNKISLFRLTYFESIKIPKSLQDVDFRVTCDLALEKGYCTFPPRNPGAWALRKAIQ